MRSCRVHGKSLLQRSEPLHPGELRVGGHRLPGLERVLQRRVRPAMRRLRARGRELHRKWWGRRGLLRRPGVRRHAALCRLPGGGRALQCRQRLLPERVHRRPVRQPRALRFELQWVQQWKLRLPTWRPLQQPQQLPFLGLARLLPIAPPRFDRLSAIGVLSTRLGIVAAIPAVVDAEGAYRSPHPDRRIPIAGIPIAHTPIAASRLPASRSPIHRSP
jgi:hypothetical protein